MTREEFIKQRCEIDKITLEKFEEQYRVVECNCGQPYCKGYRCLDLDGLLKENQELKSKLELYENRVYFSSEVDEKDKQIDKLNKKYVNAVADYETTMAEKEQLNRLVNSCQEEIRQLKKQVETYEIEGYKQNEELDKMSFDIRKYKTKQKEFIKWLEDKIKFSVKPTSRVLLKSILANYKEIIGVSDENNIK